MPRQRLGVALLVPPPAALEVDGLRRALGDGALGRVPAHLTLVPPVNVPVDRVPEALDLLRRAAGAGGPLRLRLGPAATFYPVTPVVHLAVGGDVAELHALRERVFQPPLARPLTHAFVPHVTVADDMAPERIPAAVAALADFTVEVTVDRVHLLREHKTPAGRVWRPVADAPCARPAVVGRGGLPLEIVVSDGPGPDTDPLLAAVPGAPSGRPFAVVARRDGAAVGVALGATAGTLARLDGVVVAEGERRQGVGRHLLAAVEDLARTRGCAVAVTVVPGEPAATGLLAGAGWADAGPVAGTRGSGGDGGSGAGPVAGGTGPDTRGAGAAGWRRWERPVPTG